MLARPSALLTPTARGKPSNYHLISLKTLITNLFSSFTYGTVNKAMVCQLYSVAASAIPVPSNAEQKKALIAYDIGCSI